MFTPSHTTLLLVLLNYAYALLLPPKPTDPARLSDRAADDIKAIVPVSSGQIGINPVENDLGDPSTYIGIIYGVDTQYITLDTATFTAVCLSDFLALTILIYLTDIKLYRCGYAMVKL